MPKKRRQRRPDKSGGESVFVIPDINGESGLLKTLLEMIDEGAHYPLAKGDTVVFLGQYVGRDTKGTLQLIRDFQKNIGCDVRVLTGPDDYKFMKARPSFLKTKEGIEALKSYRHSFTVARHYDNNKMDVEAIMDDRNWLATQHSFFMYNNMFFCHGCVDPDLSLEKQNVGALMFNSRNSKVRPKFQDYQEEFEKVIIHSGFTTNAKPFIKKAKSGRINRICVNTDAKRTGYLSASVIDAKTCELITTISSFNEQRYGAWKKEMNIKSA